MEFLDQFQDEFEQYAQQILHIFNPDAAGKTVATTGWVMTRLDHALAVACLYVIWVIVASTLSKTIYGKEEPPKITDLAESFRKEPIKYLQALYNPMQVALCAYMIQGSLREAFVNKDYKFICNDFSLQESGMAYWLWVFYMSKIFDFCDTVFIIFRRKWRQLSFLHVYHHLSIFLVYWLNTRAGFDGDIYYTVALNSFIHLVMYSYYTVTTFGFSVPKPIKKLVTNMQMIQFVTMNLQAIYILYNGCAFPQKITLFYLFYIISLFFLFQNFKNKTYRDPAKDQKKNK